MTFTEAVKTCYTKKYADFNGRASRSEFWWLQAFFLGVTIAVYLLIMISAVIASANAPYEVPIFAVILVGLYLAFYLVSIIPLIAVTVRRLHDTGKSGTYYLVTLIPWVGSIILLVLCALEPDRGPNMYGPDPLNPNGQALALTNPYAQPYGAGYPAQPYNIGYPAQPYGTGYQAQPAGNPYAVPTATPYAATPGQQPGSGQTYGWPYDTATPTGWPAAAPYSQPSAPQSPAQGNDQQPYGSDSSRHYGFDFDKPEGYGTGN
ncbi:DUF805 domain-containing protein [Propionibacterium australiense]|uniref:Uncharacterized protein n=1 Tax=Propionibacterium australiense TaxID=119981 RepID=A0A383S3R2_9ACTN|nr:DUF805 domain-containing protein [Propionibacterium australiense]RLP12594.1 DUF805 domain-containing protein [Propionibacterium australiense]SYZ32577.1 Protein of unknown function (DUF805) [Propionibacterium australiense]VEH91672.1 Inner membrane protein yhaI [Propionibacterium australiense]